MTEWWDWTTHIGWVWLEGIALLLALGLVMSLVLRIGRRSSR